MKRHGPFLRDLALVLSFSALLAAGLLLIASLPLRFALAAAGGAMVMGGFCLAPNRRMYVLVWMVFSMLLLLNKRLFIFTGAWVDKDLDAVYIAAMDVFLALGYGWWALEKLKGGPPPTALSRHMLIPFAVLVFSYLPSFLVTDYPLHGAAELIRVVRTVLLYWYVAHNVRDTRELRLLVACMAAGMLFELGVAVCQKYAGGALGSAMGYLGSARETEGLHAVSGGVSIVRSGGTFGHPNAFAYYLTLHLPLMLCLAFSASAPALWRAAGVAGLLAGAACLMLSLSRAGFVAGAAGLGLCFALILRRNMALKIFKGQTWLVVCLGLLVSGAMAPKMIARFVRRDAGAFSTRVYQYQVALNIISDRPWTGVGLNAFASAALPYDDTPQRITRIFRLPVHNLYLRSLAETGFPGFMGLIFLLGSALFLAWPGRFPYGDGWELHLGVFCGILANVIEANMDIKLFGSHVHLFFLLGLVAAMQARGFKQTALPAGGAA
jgi:O-antigen ligase